MKSENKYIGDEAFEKMLSHYECQMPLSVIKMRFAGAICSPNLNVRPVDIITSFWGEGKSPRLQTKEEADLFFRFFMGLWDVMFREIAANNVKLSPLTCSVEACKLRFAEIEIGFLDGFWTSEEDLKIPAYLAELLNNLTDLAEAYANLAEKELSKEIIKAFEKTDLMVKKAIEFIIENYVLPRIEDIKRSMN